MVQHDWIVPCCGLILGYILAVSPTWSLLLDRKRGVLRSDPLPYPFALTSFTEAALYGVCLDDKWLIMSNAPMVPVCFFNVLTALRLETDPRAVLKVEVATLFGSLIVVNLLVLCTSGAFIGEAKFRIAIAGNTLMFTIFCQFASPCIAAVRAIQSRDTSAISFPLSIASIVCSGFWVMYGLANGLLQLWCPNLVAMLLSAFTIVVKIYLGSCSRAPIAVILADQQNGALFRDMIVKPADQKNKDLFKDMIVNSVWDYGRKQGCTQVETSGLSTCEIISAGLSMLGKDLIAFRAADGFLSIEELPLVVDEKLWTPGNYKVVPLAMTNPGEREVFLPIECHKTRVLRLLTTTKISFPFANKQFAFWNPHFRVFLRVNERGQIDTSSKCNPVDGKVHLPEGWDWERFELSHNDGLRRRSKKWIDLPWLQ